MVRVCVEEGKQLLLNGGGKKPPKNPPKNQTQHMHGHTQMSGNLRFISSD